jgi:tellurite resistance protein TerC
MNENQLILAVFVAVVTFLLVLDIRSLFKFQDHEVSAGNAMRWTAIWVLTAMAFSGFIWYENGLEKFSQFQSAYWIEQSLSIDNLFVFLMVFKYFKITGKVQRKILLWGILGAMAMRAIFIFAGTWLIKITYLPPFWKFILDPYQHGGEGFYRINFVMTLFGIMLLYGGISSLFSKGEEEEKDFNNSFGARFFRKNFRVLTKDTSDFFWTKRNGKVFFTRLFMVLFIVETTDLIFAIDSIPAIFSIASNDPLILYTSNIFAIFGLRSMYFLLANSLERFKKLKYGISVILAFIGFKLLITPIYHIETMVSLGVILVTLLVSLFISVRAAD